MNPCHNKRSLFLLSFFVVLLCVDQLSKYLIRQYGDFFVCNENIAWGIKINSQLFWLISLFFVSCLIFFLTQKRKELIAFFLVLFLGGAISNMIDRFFWGCVFDFINLPFWPVFNLADLFITIGSGGLLSKLAKLW